MKFRIAVASKDGKVITQHFGHCRQFLIADVDSESGEIAFEDFREVVPPCEPGGHSDAGFLAVAERLKDCRFVLVSRAGTPAKNFLAERNITLLTIPGPITDAVREICIYAQKDRSL